MKTRRTKKRSGPRSKGSTSPGDTLGKEVTYVSVARAPAKGSTPSSTSSSPKVPPTPPVPPTDPKDYGKKLSAKATPPSYHTPKPTPPITPVKIAGKLSSPEDGSKKSK